jgi:hypothetical protein
MTLEEKYTKKGHAPKPTISSADYSRSNFTIELKQLIKLSKMVDDFEELRSQAYLVEMRLKEAGWI